jgi:SAM-dependent methyltransferase
MRLPTELTEQDKCNQATWTTLAARDELDYNELYTDAGERAAIEYVRDEARGKPILDLGVGMGRTIRILKPLTSDYRAIDYMPLMVRICRERYPDESIEVGDARNLAGFPSGHFGLVYFSYNGIDAVSAADRRLVFRAVRRALAPGGLFLFSSLNLDGPGYRARPWHLDLPKTNNFLQYAMSLARAVRWTPVHLATWNRLRRLSERGEGYAVAPLSAHHWGIVAHFTTLQRQLDELEREGFGSDAVVFDNKQGARLTLGDDTSRFDWFHIIARRATSSGARRVNRA